MDYDTDILFHSGFFSSLDYYFADTLLKITGENDEIIKLSAALASKATRDGHICFDIAGMAGRPILSSDQSFLKNLNTAVNSEFYSDIENFKFPSENEWLDALDSSKAASADSSTPLVIDSDNNLYLARYYDHQKRICSNISKRLKVPLPNIEKSTLEKETNKHCKSFETDNPEYSKGIISQNKIIKKAIAENFLIITGGPGTGKTYITDKISKIFRNLAGSEKPLRIISTAPTGKAASRLENGVTIHRLLKIKKNTLETAVKKAVKIAADLIIIDEASMIDISIMAKLLEAIPKTSKMIIIGDKNQLGAVEKGSVFADMCRSTMLNNHIASLDFNFRSGRQPGVSKLAKAISSGKEKMIKELLKTSGPDRFPDINFISLDDPSNIESSLRDIILEGYSPFVKEKNMEPAFKELDRFKILCSHRKTPFGTDNINIITEKLLQNYLIHDIKTIFTKSILMITKNDYNRLLFNGDMGMTVELNGQKKAVFPDDNSTLRSYNLSELNYFEKAYAITVHKSQGSEFDHVLLIIPPLLSPLLNRELLYTAVTRTRKKLTIAGDLDTITKAAGINALKKSGLTEMLDNYILKSDEEKIKTV